MRHAYFLFICFLMISTSVAQERDTLIYDAVSGDYIIRYKGTFPYSRKADGALRKLTRDDSLQSDEEYIEIDSLVTVIFEPETKVDPSVVCVVTPDSTKTSFLFSYEIANGFKAKQNIFDFLLEFGHGLLVRSLTRNNWFNRQRYEAETGKPTSIFSWFPTPNKSKPIERGKTLGGFIIESGGLPGIQNAYFAGERSRMLEFPGGGPVGKIGQEVQRLKTFPLMYVMRKTIAPTAPPDPFIPLAFLDTLISYKHQALALGWLRDKKDDDHDEDEQAEDGIVKNLDKRLDKARKELIKGDSAKARKELEKLVKKVEKIYKKSEEAKEKKRESEVTMTSEAYGLLKYNAEYLIERLPEKSREKPRRDRD